MITLFFLLVEISFYGFAIYLFFYKGELALLYLPVLFFAYITITPVAPAILFYALIVSLIGRIMYQNLDFFKYNVFALLLAILFLWLLRKTTNIVEIRPFVFSSMCLFVLIPLTYAVFVKYSRQDLFKELYISALLVLVLFVLNAVFSTLSGYAPTEMYGISSGILYGNLYATDFNILAFSLFIVLYRLISKPRPLDLILFVFAFCFTVLSLRRSVIGLSVVAIVVLIFILLSRNQIAKVMGFLSVGLLLAVILFFGTDFIEQFLQRYELRDLDDRALSEEKRFFEYDMLYTDTFVSFDYDPWFGYGLFDSGGNYGKGALGPRTLHGDITNIIHSSGIIGVLLYLSMIITAFVQAIRRTKSYTDLFIIAFCLVAFLVYTITGRYTQIGSMLMMILLLMLPLGKIKRKVIKTKPTISSLQVQ